MSNPLLDPTTLLRNPRAWTIIDASVAARPRPAPYEADGQAFQTAGHIPGARFADLVSAFSDPMARFPFTRPSAAQFQSEARKLGLSRTSRIAIYDRSNGIWAARLWWLFRSFGHEDAFVLDGGLKAWEAAGLPLEQGPAISPAEGDFVAREQVGYFVDTPEVADIVEGRSAATLLNVLRRPVFSGEEQNYARPGHIPGSLNIPYAELIDPATNRLFDVEALRNRFQPIENAAGPVVAYCGGGITAAGAALALARLGRNDVVVYDGSLSAWTADERLPLETTSDVDPASR